MRIDPESPLARALDTSKPPTRAEALALVRRAQAGDTAARDELVTRNLRLVARVAYWYRGARTLERSDLIAEGTMGLLRAIELFDHVHGTAFSTYATWWVRQRIAAAVADYDATIRRPRGSGKRHHRVASLDHQARTGEDETTLGELLPDPEAVDPADDAAQQELRARLDAALASMPRRDADLLRLRFGLRPVGSGHACSLAEVGQVFRITRERVRQLENRALRRLAKRLSATPHAAAAS